MHEGVALDLSALHLEAFALVRLAWRCSPGNIQRHVVLCQPVNLRPYFRSLSSKAFNPALHGGLIAVRHVHHPDPYQSAERWVVSIRMLFEIGTHAGDCVRKVAGVDVFERPSFAPSEMLVTRHSHAVCVSDRHCLAGPKAERQGVGHRLEGG